MAKRWDATILALDEAHAILREHPAVTVDDFRPLLPPVACFCADPKWHSPKGWTCWNCTGTGLGPPQRSTAYNLLAKLLADGRARRDTRAVPHQWFAVVDAETALVDGYWEALAEQAPHDPVAEFRDLAADRARVLAELDTIDAKMDAIVHGIVEAHDTKTDGPLRDVAKALGIAYSHLTTRRWRHWDRTRDREDDEATA